MNWSKFSVVLGLAATLSTGRALAATKAYDVGHFSDEFRATVTVEDSQEVFRPGSVSVYERKSGKRLLHVEASELAFDLEQNGEVAPNVVELPYGRQSVVIYEDFDLDGRRDLAIMDGQKSCYHGPSFQIFVREGKGFKKSRAFTRLAQEEYCGMFQVDRAEKRIYTMTKSGCCWHRYDSYAVVKRAPVLLESVEESAVDGSYLRRATRGRRASLEYFLLPPEESISKVLLSFDLAGPRPRHVEVFVTEGYLDYALVVGPDRRVEYSQRLHARPRDLTRKDAEPEPFLWDPAKRELSFETGAYRYVVHDGEEPGVTVSHLGEVTFLPAIASSRRGSLQSPLLEHLANATVTLMAP
jgi:hypothetical protein